MQKLVLVVGIAAMTAATALAQAPTPLTGAPAAVEPAARAEVLVLGVYHMANPGRDVFNMKADDVLAPKRQAEMAELVGVLKSSGRRRSPSRPTSGTRTWRSATPTT